MKFHQEKKSKNVSLLVMKYNLPFARGSFRSNGLLLSNYIFIFTLYICAWEEKVNLVTRVTRPQSGLKLQRQRKAEEDNINN